MTVRFSLLSSGSRGNCLYLEGPEGALLVDSGLSWRETSRRLAKVGGRPESIRALLVTHEHTDHVRGLSLLARRLSVPVYATGRTLTSLPGLGHLTTRPLTPGVPFSCAGFRILPFSLPHDAADPVGFLFEGGGISVGVATDLGYATTLVRQRLAGCAALVLESNHDERMLIDGPYPWFLKQRIRGRRGHLSNPDAAGLLLEVAHPALQQVVLAHLSETNNLPHLALGCAREALGAGWGARLAAAAADSPTPLLTLDA